MSLPPCNSTSSGPEFRRPRRRIPFSFADRQIVEFAKVLSIEERTQHEPIILLDEPTSVLEAEEIDRVLALIKRLRDRASVVFVSHRLDEVLRVSDRIYVMTNGRCVAQRDPELCDVAELQRLMLGRELSTAYDKKSARPSTAFGAVRLSVRDLSHRGSYETVSFDLHAGEVPASPVCKAPAERRSAAPSSAPKAPTAANS